VNRTELADVVAHMNFWGNKWVDIETGVHQRLLAQWIATSFETGSKATQSVGVCGSVALGPLFVDFSGLRVAIMGRAAGILVAVSCSAPNYSQPHVTRSLAVGARCTGSS
jgi:hypothetical protein